MDAYQFPDFSFCVTSELPDSDKFLQVATFLLCWTLSAYDWAKDGVRRIKVTFGMSFGEIRAVTDGVPDP